VLDTLDDARLVTLLERARVVIAPTAYEGFGLAAGEARRAGVPGVFADDCPLHVLVGDGGLAAPPTAEAMAAAARVVWHDAAAYAERAARRAAGYTWRRTAEAMLERMAGRGD
jgi:glycosyltransferase involved in cell wall biosynthesis